jgi:hypothetical protein
MLRACDGVALAQQTMDVLATDMALNLFFLGQALINAGVTLARANLFISFANMTPHHDGPSSANKSALKYGGYFYREGDV